MSLAAFRGVGALRNVGKAARLVLYALADHHNGKTGLCCPAQGTIAEHAGLDRRSVQRAIAELVTDGLLGVVSKGGVGSGDKRTDAYLLLFPLIEEQAAPRPAMGDSVSPMGGVAPHKSGSNQEENGSNARETRELDPEEPIEGVDLDSAVAVIWAGVGDNGRRRSAKAKVKKALSAALGRRPRGVGAEDHLKRVLQGVRAYLAHPDTRKEGGRFEHGAHRTLENDVWESFLDDAPARVAQGERQAADPDLGSVDAPGPKLMRYWMETHGQGLPWHGERGPRPGMPGCRVSDEIQREFGVEPYAAPGDDDASAFL